jgi:DNA-binding NarL/FixJ family response regulator
MARTVLIVDDHAGFRTQARALLERAGYEVVGEADDGRSGLEAVGRLRPDLVLLDVQLPDLMGFDVARRIIERADPPTVILVSSRDASDYGGSIDSSGARGFISKTELSAGAVAALLEERAGA